MARQVALPPTSRRALTRWYGDEVLERAILVQGSLIGRLFGRFGQHAVTVNKTVHYALDAPELDSDRGVALLGHELYHVEQQMDMGWWFFLARYLWRWRPSHVNQGWTHPMEAPAYRRGREIREALSS